ncbi:MAG: hypothetical protein IKQ46_00180 [Bacteroidales bacterium]|nr:hypothetical protein [Bacteroidales bacterium]
MEDFNSVLQNFKNEVDNFSAISEGYRKLNQLVQEHKEIDDVLRKDTQYLQTAINTFNNKVYEFKKEINLILETGFGDNNKLIKTSFEKLSNMVDKISIDNKNYHIALNGDVKRLLNTGFNNNKQILQESLENIRKEIENIVSENKKFHSDLADSIKLRLDNNKLEIKQIIDSESTKLISIVSENSNSLIKQTEEKYKKIFTMVCVFGAINTLLFILLLIFK